jgi:DNA-binding XRE family transcriptional regulator
MPAKAIFFFGQRDGGSLATLQGVLRIPRTKRKPLLRHRKSFGDAIRVYRKQTGLTQEELAEAVDLNPKYVGEIERGDKIISIEALLRISKAVKVPMLEFFRDM